MINYENSRARKIGRLSAGIAALLLAGQSMADPAPAAYNMAVIQDDAYGLTVMSGNYAKGIARINSFASKRAKSFAVQNNLCVAYTMTKDFDNAASACEAALTVSEKYGKVTDIPINTYTARDQALAYSNRGVLRAVTGDHDGAKQDFEYASRLSKRFDAATNNLARLKTQEATSLSSL
jgi:Flp pilus assembly protein TadD